MTAEIVHLKEIDWKSHVEPDPRAVRKLLRLLMEPDFPGFEPVKLQRRRRDLMRIVDGRTRLELLRLCNVKVCLAEVAHAE